MQVEQDKASGYGVDVASTRADDIDKLILNEILTLKEPTVLDIGCGSGGQSARMALAGADVTGVDITDYSESIQALKNTLPIPATQFRFTQADVRAFTSTMTTKQYHLCIIQRTLHYLPYSDALSALQQFKQAVAGTLYLSVSGLESAIGTAYQGKAEPIQTRFCPLDAHQATLFSIAEPICLYSQAEFITLLELSGWEIKKVWISAFGNHKAVCQ